VGQLSQLQSLVETTQASYTQCQQELGKRSEGEACVMVALPAYDAAVAILTIWVVLNILWDYCHHHPLQFPGNR